MFVLVLKSPDGEWLISHFRITLALFFEASLGAYPFICKTIFIYKQILLMKR